MFRTLILSLAVFCCVQAETPDEVIQEMKPKLDALDMQIDTYVENVSKSIRLSVDYLSTIGGASMKLFDQALIVLNETVEISKTDANANGQNIEQCVTQEELAVQNVTNSGLLQCRSVIIRVQSLSSETNEMIKHKYQIEQAPEACGYDINGDAVKLRSCLEDMITRIDTHLVSIIQFINESVSSYQQTMRECIDTNLNEIYLEIEQILSGFKDCINKS